jgi:hypothetical protein
MRSLRPPAVLILAAALSSGCGESDAKRTLDAQTEALRFYGANTSRIALIYTSEEAGISSEALASLRSLPPWGALWLRTFRVLRSSGIPTERLDRLMRGSETIEGLPASQMAVELTRPEASLTVLVTDAPEEMDKLFEGADDRGSLTRKGELDDASIFESRDGAFAVRDGVMILAASTARLRQAIRTRDGDRDEQVDDGDVEALLEQLPEQPRLHVYAKPAVDSPGPVREAMFAIRDVPNGLRIDAFARLAEGDLERGPTLGRLLTGAPARQETVRLENDEIQATLRISR